MWLTLLEVLKVITLFGVAIWWITSPSRPGSSSGRPGKGDTPDAHGRR